MVAKELSRTGSHTALVALALGDPVLMLRSILCWLRSRFVSGAVCACVGACLLLHYCSVCQVRNGKCPIIFQSCDADCLLPQKDYMRADYIKCGWQVWVFKCDWYPCLLLLLQYVTVIWQIVGRLETSQPTCRINMFQAVILYAISSYLRLEFWQTHF